jgi:hypothetical protein
MDKTSSGRVSGTGLRRSALEATAAIDSESPLVEIGKEHREPKCEKAAHQQRETDQEDQEALI